MSKLNYQGTIILNLIERYNLNFNRGNIIKYVSRTKDSNLSNLRKAQTYLNREMEKEMTEADKETLRDLLSCASDRERAVLDAFGILSLYEFLERK